MNAAQANRDGPTLDESRFLSLVSHEFRTPLTVILSSCDLLENYGDSWEKPRRQSHFRRIQESVASMASLLDNVTLLSRLESGHQQVSPERISPDDLLSALDGEISPVVRTGQELVLSSLCGSEEVSADPRLLRAVLANLAVNALRFSPRDGKIEVRLRVLPEGFEVSVSDRGTGLPPGEEARLWAPFERGSNCGGIPGSGLGLAIVRRCMELSGGTVALSPREGGGLVAVALFPRGGRA
jgi:signal transduction histidine kinase